MSEIEVMRRLQIRASALGSRLFRQNSGQGCIGKVERGPGVKVLGPNDIVIRSARPFHAGFEGLSDLGGWSPLPVTAGMVGATIAVYTQFEVKAGAATTKPQLAWIEAVNKAGGRAGVARSEDDLEAILSR